MVIVGPPLVEDIEATNPDSTDLGINLCTGARFSYYRLMVIAGFSHL